MERNTKRKLVDIGILAGACLVVALLLRTPLFGGIGAYIVMVASVLVTVVLCIVCSIVCMLFGDVPAFSDFAGFSEFCTEGDAWYFVLLFAMVVVWTVVVVQILNERTPKLPESLKKLKEPIGYKVLDHVEVRRKGVVDIKKEVFKSLKDGAKNLHVGYVAEDLYSSSLYEVVEINGEQVKCRLLEDRKGTIFVFRYAQLLPCVKEDGQLVAMKETVYYYMDGSVEVR